jgi:hypothetical protein
MVEQAEAKAVVLAAGYVSKAMGRDWRAAPLRYRDPRKERTDDARVHADHV